MTPQQEENLINAVILIGTKVDGLSNTVDTLSNTVGTLSNTVGTLSNTVDTISSRVDTLSNTVDKFSADAEKSDFKFDTYQRVTQSIVSLAFGLIASATVVTIISSVFKR